MKRPNEAPPCGNGHAAWDSDATYFCTKPMGHPGDHSCEVQGNAPGTIAWPAETMITTPGGRTVVQRDCLCILTAGCPEHDPRSQEAPNAKGEKSMRCTHCGNDICDPCWKARVDRRERGDLSEELLARIEGMIRSAKSVDEIWTTPAEALSLIREVRRRRAEVGDEHFDAVRCQAQREQRSDKVTPESESFILVENETRFYWMCGDGKGENSWTYRQRHAHRFTSREAALEAKKNIGGVNLIRLRSAARPLDYPRPDARIDVLEAAERICREAEDEYTTMGDGRRATAAEECADRIATFANTFRAPRTDSPKGGL